MGNPFAQSLYQRYRYIQYQYRHIWPVATELDSAERDVSVTVEGHFSQPWREQRDPTNWSFNLTCLKFQITWPADYLVLKICKVCCLYLLSSTWICLKHFYCIYRQNTEDSCEPPWIVTNRDKACPHNQHLIQTERSLLAPQNCPATPCHCLPARRYAPARLLRLMPLYTKEITHHLVFCVRVLFCMRLLCLR